MNLKGIIMSSLLTEMAQFTIEDRVYTFKRLGIKAVFEILEITKSAWKSGILDLNIHLEHLRMVAPNQEAADKLQITPDLLLFFSVDHCLEDFMSLMENHLLDVTDKENPQRVTLADLSNEDLFPAYSLVTLAAFFLAHPDIGMFVSHFNEGKQLPFVQAVMGKAQDLNPSS